MPGLVGLVAQSGQDAGPSFDRMLQPMQRGRRLIVERRVDRRWALGRVHLNVLQPATQLTAAGPTPVAFHGELANQSELKALLAGQAPATDAALVAALYQQFGTAAIAKLKGSFALAIVDTAQHQVVIASDRVGSYPLYWLHENGTFAFAGEARALVRIQGSPRLDAATLNDLLHFGSPFGDKTMAAGVRLLPSASTLTYQWERGTVSLDTHSSWGPAFAASGIGRDDYMERLGVAFEAAMDRATIGPHRYGLSLSGGLDTRALLAVLDQKGIPLSTFTLGGRGCADEVIGYQLAKMCRSEHHFIPLEERYLDELLPMAARMVSLTDGLYTSHGFTEVLALQSFEANSFDMLLRGHAGELAKASTAYPLHTDPQIFEMRSVDELVPHLMARMERLNHGSSARGVFSQQWSDASNAALAERTLRGSFDVDLSPPDLCSYVYLHEYHRRVTIPSLEIFREAVEVRVPFADEQFIPSVLQAPPQWRDGLTIHQSLIRRTNPRYLKVRNPNTGAPAGAGPMQEFVLDKVNTILRRLNVYGYRHYHAFDGWMRTAFLKIAESALLSDASLSRGVLDKRGVEAQLARAKAGDAAPDHVLQVLLVAELWQRENVQ